jgi:hypothetical protein
MRGDLFGMGVDLTLFCGQCCAQELAGRRTPRRRRRKRPPTTTKANPSGNGKERAIYPDTDNSGGTLSFGAFALHDLRAGEEVVLAWELG